MVKPRRMSVIDRTGERYGKLTVTARAPNTGSGKQAVTNWLCKCDCGNITIVRGATLAKAANGKRGGARSCGCLVAETQRERLTSHGKSRSRAYKVWVAMLQRCNNPNQTGWASYGGRGIKVCEAWHNFEAFHNDMGDPPHRMTLDRIDVDGDYCKANCRWATRREQSNNRRNNVLITHEGQTRTLAEWERLYDLPRTLLSKRLRYGWTPERAITTPP